VKTVFEFVSHLSVGPRPANRFKLFFAPRVTSPMQLLVQNFILIGCGVSAGQVPENCMFPNERVVVLNTVLSAAALPRDCKNVELFLW
jgi:hypothetical protein